MADNAAVQYFLPVTIAMINLSLGLGLTGADFRRVVERPKAVSVGAVAQLFGLPLLGFSCALGFALGPELAVGMVLITACPGGAHSNLFANLARGDTALSVTLTALSGVASIGLLPLWMAAASRLFEAGDIVQLPVLHTVGQIFAVVGVPLALGMALRALSETWAGRLEGIVKGLAVLLLLVIVVGAVARQADRVVAFARDVGLAVLVLHLLGMGAGFVLAAGTGLPREQRVTISLEVGVQNSALAVGIAMTLLDDTGIAVPAIVYSLLVYATSALLIAWARLVYLRPSTT